MRTVAAVLHRINSSLQFEELILSPLRPNDVLLKVTSTGLCRSDYHLMTGDSSCFLPIVLGHETLATVLAVGDAVTSIKVGDVVVPGIVPSCGSCELCKKGQSSLCSSLPISVVAGPQPDGSFRWFLGEDAKPVGQYCFLGAFAECLITGDRQVVKVPTELASIPEACVLGCAVASGAGALFNLPDFKPGASVAVVGIGGIGASVLLAASAAGACRISAVDSQPNKRTLAETLGASAFLQPEDAPAVFGQFDYVFECVGTKLALQTALKLTTKCGTCVAIGMPRFNELAAIDWWDLVTEQKTLRGSVHGSGDMALTLRRVLALWKKKQFRFEALVTHRYPLTEINVAFSDMMAGKGLRGIIVM